MRPACGKRAVPGTYPGCGRVSGEPWTAMPRPSRGEQLGGRSGRRDVGLARYVGKPVQPVGPGGKQNTRDASNERRPRYRVGVTKGSASQQGLESAPAAPCGDAWVETPPRLLA